MGTSATPVIGWRPHLQIVDGLTGGQLKVSFHQEEGKLLYLHDDLGNVVMIKIWRKFTAATRSRRQLTAKLNQN